MWARLSVFVDGFELDAVEGICADEKLPAAGVLAALTGLVDKSILVCADHSRGSISVRRCASVGTRPGLGQPLVRAGCQLLFARAVSHFTASMAVVSCEVRRPQMASVGKAGATALPAGSTSTRVVGSTAVAGQTWLALEGTDWGVARNALITGGKALSARSTVRHGHSASPGDAVRGLPKRGNW
jgi:hypothetical protein